MKTGWMMWVGCMVAVGGAMAVARPAEASVAVPQQVEADCRCVDADGDPIDDCRCFRMPRFEMGFAPFGARPRLGISVDTDQAGTVDAQGARVARVLEDGPASDAGLEEGDIITRIGGRSLLEPLDADVEADFDVDESLPVQRLLSLARELDPGEQVAIEYLRDGVPASVTVEAEELSARSYALAFDAGRMRVDAERLREELRDMSDGMRRLDFRGRDGSLVIGPLGSARYGLELIELSPGLGDYFGTSEGVLVTDVDDDATLGLRPGDVILRVGDRDVGTPARVLRLLATYEGDEEITFRIRRNGAELNVMGRLPG